MYILILLFFLILLVIVYVWNTCDYFEIIEMDKKIIVYDINDKKEQYVRELVKKIEELVQYCKTSSYPNKECSERLYNNWKNVTIKELVINRAKDHVAYVVNKNEEFRLCITKGPDQKEELEDQNTCMFVILHELSHMMSESYGHNTEFYNNFLSLLRIGNQLNIYKPENFKQENKMYCGTNITSSPCDYNSCTI